jgi:hypothetical protein
MKAMNLNLLLTCTFLSSVTLVESQGVVSFRQHTSGGGGGGTNQVQGWEFVPQTDVTVLELGLYDGHLSGGFQQSHEVAIWDGNGDLITSAFIPQGESASLLDNFRYEDINPIQLNAGDTYVIGALMIAPVTDYTVLWERSAISNGIVSFDPRIEFVAYREGPSPSGISFPQSRWVDYVGGFGPNFIIAVPEPSSFTLLLAMAGTSMLWARCRRAPFSFKFVVRQMGRC